MIGGVEHERQRGEKLAAATLTRMRDFTHQVGKRVDVFEVAIDRREADVGHLVDLLQFLHDHLADLLRRNLTFAERQQLLFDARDRGIDRFDRDRPLAQSQPETG